MQVGPQLAQLRTLQAVLLRQGILPATAYWASPWRVFFINFMGGAWAGVAVIVAAAIGLGFGAQRVGHDSTLYQLARGLLVFINEVRIYLGQF